MDWVAILIWFAIIAAVIIYCVVMAATFLTAADNAKDAAKRRDVHLRKVKGFEDTLSTVSNPNPDGLYATQTRERMEKAQREAQREAKVENVTAIISLWVMYTAFLWPLWFVIFGLTKVVNMLGMGLFWVGMLVWLGVEAVLKNSLATWKATKR